MPNVLFEVTETGQLSLVLKVTNKDNTGLGNHECFGVVIAAIWN